MLKSKANQIGKSWINDIEHFLVFITIQTDLQTYLKNNETNNQNKSLISMDRNV